MPLSRTKNVANEVRRRRWEIVTSSLVLAHFWTAQLFLSLSSHGLTHSAALSSEDCQPPHRWRWQTIESRGADAESKNSYRLSTGSLSRKVFLKTAGQSSETFETRDNPMPRALVGRKFPWCP